MCIDLKKLFAQTAGEARKPIEFGGLLESKRRPTHLDRLLYNSDLLPLTFLTDRDNLRQRLAQYRQNLGKRPDTKDLADFVDVNLEGYVDVFFDYGFPTVILPASLDLEAVANVFTKINTTGLKLSAFDLCVAALYPKGIRLRGLLEAAHDRDEVRVVDADGTNILQTCALRAGLPRRRQHWSRTSRRTRLTLTGTRQWKGWPGRRTTWPMSGSLTTLRFRTML